MITRITCDRAWSHRPHTGNWINILRRVWIYYVSVFGIYSYNIWHYRYLRRPSYEDPKCTRAPLLYMVYMALYVLICVIWTAYSINDNIRTTQTQCSIRIFYKDENFSISDDAKTFQLGGVRSILDDLFKCKKIQYTNELLFPFNVFSLTQYSLVYSTAQVII
jgi:hypothetical protein